LRSTLLIALAASVAATSANAAPADANAHAFYMKARSLMAKGPLAALSGDIKSMKAQMADAGARVRVQNLAAKMAGAPLYCPPADRKGAGADFVIDGLAAVLESRRKQLTLVQAWREILIARFPCK